MASPSQLTPAQLAVQLIQQQFIDSPMPDQGSSSAGFYQQPQLATVVKKRPLNSWMAFRSFYFLLFSNAQQKEISTYLTVLWQQDPFKAKWTILAKAYSFIRDRIGKENAPLDKFLELCCPAMGIIPANEYLEKMNWVVATNTKGEDSLQQIPIPDLSSFSSKIIQSSLNDMDLIAVCINRGYMPPAAQVFSNTTTDGCEFLMSIMPAFNPRPESVSFLNAITADPKGMAAHIFGFDIDHPFLQISTAPNDVQLEKDNYISPGHEVLINLKEVPHPKDIQPAPVPIIQESPYKWTGNMSDLYRPAENPIDFAPLMTDEEWNTTNVKNPYELDGYLELAGYDPQFLHPNLPDDPNLEYNFWDSF